MLTWLAWIPKIKGAFDWVMSNKLLVALIASGVVIIGLSIATWSYKSSYQSSQKELAQLEIIYELGATSLSNCKESVERAQRESELRQEEAKKALEEASIKAKKYEAEAHNLLARPREPSKTECQDVEGLLREYIAKRTPGVAERTPGGVK